MARFAVLFAVMLASSSAAFRIASYNLRYDSMPDKITVNESLASLPDPSKPASYYTKSGEQPWSLRRIYVAERVINEGTAILGIQEGLVRQINDLVELLGDQWAYVGVGRNDGKTAGEYSAIYYRKDVVSLRSVDYFWLSNTPSEPSKFPGAGSIRICTAGKFTTADGIDFTILNTHLDDQSDAQRQLGGSMLLMRARYEAAVSKEPVIVMGDFNSPPVGNDSGAYQIATGAIPPVAVNQTFADKYAVPNGELPDFKLLDFRSAGPRLRVGRNYGTYTGWSSPTNTSAWGHIDFILGGNNGGWNVQSFKVETSLTDDGVLASDHRPVFADVTL